MGRVDDVGETSLAAATAAIITARWSALQSRPARAQVSDGGGVAGDHAAWAPPANGFANGTSSNGTYATNGHGTHPPDPYANGSHSNDSAANGSHANGSYESVDAFGSDTYRSGAHVSDAAEAPYEPPYGDAGFGDVPFTSGFGGTSFGDDGHGIGGRGIGTGPGATAFGETPSSYGESASSYGEVPSTYGETPSTYGETPSTYGETPSSYGEPASSYGETPLTYGDTPLADGGAAPTYGEAAPTYGEAAPTYGGAAPTYGEAAPTYGEAPSGEVGGGAPEADGNGYAGEGPGHAAEGHGYAPTGNGYPVGGNGFSPAASSVPSDGGGVPVDAPERLLPRAAHGDAAARGAAAASFFAATQLDSVPEVFPTPRIPGQRAGDVDDFSLGSVMADLPFPEPFVSFEPPSFDPPSFESLSFGGPSTEAIPVEKPTVEVPPFDRSAFEPPAFDGRGFSAFGPPSGPTLPADEVTGTRVPPGFERRTFGPYVDETAPPAPAMGHVGIAPPSPGFAEFAPGLDPGPPPRLEPAGLPRRGHAAEPDEARGPIALLPRRVPQVPDVPNIALFANDPLLDPTAAPSADGFELTRIATYLRDDEDHVVAEHRPDGFDFADVLEAVRGVRDVRDAHLRWNTGAGHTLRIEFTDGANEGDVTREVVRLLREKMGLAAAPSVGALGSDEATLDRPYARPRASVIASATVPVRPGVGVSVGNATRGGTRRPVAPALPRPSHVDGSGPRVVVDHVTVTTLGADATVEVRLVLSRGGSPAGAAVGSGRGPAVDAYLLRLAATSAAGALDQLLTATDTARGRCFVEHVAVVPFGVVEVAVVVLLLAHGGHTEQLAGSAVVAGDPQQAVVRATLAALNRRLESLLS